ncbi:MAG TPA: exonuclease domain-containing protein [Bacteroidales bacterium]|nr:exonuclease domain-containing protein [Bacteroidales bacterium]
MYAIVDIETTGGSHKNEKITEIAIFVHDGTKVVNEFSTLINPEKNIPYFITGLTGITNEMVADAPKFYEVAKRIVKLTEDCVFVGHNVNFDYHFVREEFQRLGYEYKRDVLCTVKMSRKLIPGKRSYSLGNLCNDLGIGITDRHRAAGDALATVKLFELLQTVNNGPLNGSKKHMLLSQKDMHPALDYGIIQKLPHETGVYTFHNEKGDIIYIGKSNDIHDRVISHFNNTTTKKALEMRGQIADVGYEKTGSELVALLLESFQIKKHKPLYNRLQRRSLNHYGLYTYNDSAGYIRFFIDKNASSDAAPLVSFNSPVEARQFLSLLVQKYKLCQKLCGLYESQGACFHYQISECNGACIGSEDPSSYNQRANQIISNFEYEEDSFFILDRGRNSGEYAVVQINNGKYLGFGYLNDELSINSSCELCNCIKNYPDNREIQQIIKSFIKSHPKIKLIKY